MIAMLRGEVVEKDESLLILDVSGVGYAVSVGSAMAARTGLGETLTFSISTQVREDSITLYGFEDSHGRRLFEQLLSVSGVGPKMGMALIDTLGFKGLIRALQEEDARALTAVSGVGKKTAQRLLLEMRGKVSMPFIPGPAAGVTTAPAAAEDPLRLALARLGYRKSEIDRAVSGVEEAGEGNHNLQARLSAALRVLSGRT
ncbi:MAG: Holliday junction branch migration protein RuvA [Myxococcota bacterium]|nr:Holliday junction branch migration protein RuvA [Myxococcota bacterium]